MHKLTINEMLIFSVKEKRAKHVEFLDKINVITSSKQNGTKKGKSAIMKSIYHTLGADCFFEDKWNINDKVNILRFTVNSIDYYLLRYQRLFKLYTADDKKEVFRTCNRTELAEELGKIFNFKVMLPNKETGNIEVTPPAFNYLLNYIDQDGMDGSKFQSFVSLQQYSDYKDKVLYYHFGVYTEEYYRIVKDIEDIEEKLQSLQEKIKVCQSMVLRINNDLQDSDYSSDLEALEKELEINKQEYVEYRSRLVKCKKTLLKYRNTREDLLSTLADISEFSKEVSAEVKKIIKHECPYCHSEITDNVELRIHSYNSIEDALFMKAGLEEDLAELERKIEKEEKKYQEHLELMNAYEKRLNSFNDEINDVLRYKGFIEMKDSLIKELGDLTLQVKDKEDALEKEKKKKKQFDAEKKKVNERYYNLMMYDKNRFGLKEISENKLKDIKSVIKAGGSNKPIATIIWYMNLLKIKHEFNKNAIVFPMVFDSPNNAETDEEKRRELLQYLFDSVDEDTQLIISTLGFDENEFSDVEISQVINLDNEKYQVLNTEDYEAYKDLFISLMGSDL